MKADMTKKKLVTLKNNETACLGGAILAGVGTGVFESVESVLDLIELENTYTPNDVDYTDCYENYIRTDNVLNIKL